MGSTPRQLGDSTRGTLRRLSTLRWVGLAVMASAVGVASAYLDLELPLAPLFAVLAAAAGLNLWTEWRLRRPGAVSERSVFGQLLADIGTFAGIMYFTGGWSNPFVSTFLLPLVIAATVLKARHAWAIAGATFAAYSALGFFYVPLPHLHHGGGGDFDLHVLGMWVSFVLSAGAIAYFVVKMAESLRQRDRQLAEARERALRDQQVLALGTLAAGAAHQLGTPLSTMAVMLKELAVDRVDDPSLASDLRTLRTQVDACKTIISDLVAAAGQSRIESGRAEDLQLFLERTVENWRALRPGADVTVQLEGSQPVPRIVAERSLAHTLVTLLDNAADASEEGIELRGTWTPAMLTVEIRDRGEGVAPDVLDRAGRSPLSTKPEGQGVGLMIANSALERLGGRVTLSNRVEGGACTTVLLPLSAISAG